ncbi:RDD family protein [Amycolatopsis jiangsuensis]|uniref:Putative RDD family membrane protein YckC n=1 Tax=Amycolatopsis jiangsuensis TaxID=1181879 RepID=A0A840IVN7_9PSEU|nr:RDD family protein [Amycolatopsis jiangsuensis]MBB4685930.1 putative RDD family membrane protein YckC [Amycolatopsis jiangsuensis]
MARWTGEWLPGTGDPTTREDPPKWPGARFGLPESGVGAVAGGGQRLLALIVDLVFASLVTALFQPYDLQNVAAMQTFNLWAGAVWAVLTVIAVTFFGFTPGMGVLGIRVARLDGVAMVGPWRALVRMVLTVLIVPLLVRNADSRTWLDRATGTVVIRMR